MSEQGKPDARTIYRILAAIVGAVCVALLIWSAFSGDQDQAMLAGSIFAILGLPMIRLATTGYFIAKS